MKKGTCSIIFVLAFTLFSSAQDDNTSRPYVKTGFVIIQSTKNYASAKTTAVAASKRLNSKLDLRGLKPNKKNGLTFSAADCENEGGYPCYIARGRYDAGKYVSIEWSDAYEGFAKGYYIVIVASGSKADTDAALAKAKKIYKDAYNKATEVYVGCMH
jgi:hypothetical protein